MSSDPDFYREKAREFALKARLATNHEEWRMMKAFAKSNVLLEINAKWLASTDRFLDAVKNNRPWPAPDVTMPAEAQQNDS